jgi:hypothetical protein
MPAPTITSVDPPSCQSGLLSLEITITGTGFTAGMTALWSGVALSTVFVSATECTATIPQTLLATPGGGYITVVTSGGASTAVPFLVSSPLDLVTVSQVKAWISAQGLPSTNATDDVNIQECLSAISVQWLWRTGHGPSDGTVPTQSPFVEPVAFNENYDGNNSNRLFLRQTPIVSVAQLSISGVMIPQSTGYSSAGFAIHQDGRSIIIRNGGGFGAANVTTTSFFGFFWTFLRDVNNPQNINVQYTAGYAATPVDVMMTAIEMTAQNYKRRAWIDQKSQALANGAGTTTFRDWEFSPNVLKVMNAYTRRAIVY